jgi:hypothetical protein
VLLLAAVVALAALVTRSGGVVSADEGAMLAELDLLERTGEWSEPNPEPAVDPDMVAPPLELSDRTAEGRWAPFAKHPVHIAVLRLPWAVGGHTGVLVASLASVVVAAWAAARVAGRIRPGTEVATLWAAGVGSPLIFYGFQVVGHAMGAATFGLAVLAAVLALDDGSRRRRAVVAAAAVVLVALTGLIRSEGVLAGLALGGALGWVGLRGRGRAAFALGTAVGVAALAVLVLEPLLIEAVMGGPLLESTSTIPSEGFLADRWSGFRITVVDPGYGVEGGEVFLALSTVLLLAAGLVWRLRRNDQAATLLVAGAAALGIVRLATTDFLVPGLLQATPVLTVAMVLLTVTWARAWPARVLVLAAGAFVAAVVATQYRTGGTGEWGGRYFAVGLPVLVALAVPLLADQGDELAPPRRRLVAVCLAVTSVALALGAVRVTADARDASETVADAVVAEVDAADVDATISTNGAISRFAWEAVMDGRRWLTSGHDDLDEITSRLAEPAGQAGRIALVTRALEDDLALVHPAWREESTTEVRPDTYVVVLVPVDG